MEQSNERPATDTGESGLGWPLLIAGFIGIAFAEGIGGALVGVGFSRPWRYSGLDQAQAHSNLSAVVFIIALAVILVGVYKKFGDVTYGEDNSSRTKMSLVLYVAVAFAAVIAGYYVGAIDERAFTIKTNATFILLVFPLYLIADTFLNGRYVTLACRAASLPVFMALASQIPLVWTRADAISQNARWAAGLVLLALLLVAIRQWIHGRRTGAGTDVTS